MGGKKGIETKVQDRGEGIWDNFKGNFKELSRLFFPNKMFLIPGFLGLMSKAYRGPAENFIHEYFADVAAPVALYFLTKSFLEPGEVGKSLEGEYTRAPKLTCALVPTLICFYGELAQATDFLPNPFLSRGANPYDLIAYTIGSALGIGLDFLIDKVKKKKGEKK